MWDLVLLIQLFIPEHRNNTLFSSLKAKSILLTKRGSKMFRNLLIASLLILSTSITHASEQTEKNKKLVTHFYQEVLFEGKYQLIDKYMGSKYIQHNPNVADGKQGLKNLVKSLIPKTGNVKPFGEIKKVMADNDIVILHIKTFHFPGKNGGALVDIFRVKDNKIVEHWDVLQAIPDKAANNNTMF